MVIIMKKKDCWVICKMLQIGQKCGTCEAEFKENMVAGKIKTNRNSCTLHQDNKKDASRISESRNGVLSSSMNKSIDECRAEYMELVTGGLVLPTVPPFILCF